MSTFGRRLEIAHSPVNDKLAANRECGFVRGKENYRFSNTMDKLRDNDTIGKIEQDQIISDFRIRSIERSKDAPWSYVVFGVNEIHKIKNGTEVTDRIVGQYNLRLMEDRRTELNPSGLLVADYSEQQMVGERDNGLLQRSELDK